MRVELNEITVRDLVEDYFDDGEGGVKGYGGRLDIRPPFQREFVYKEMQRNAVIDTVNKGFPLNVMYWALREDGSFEVIDGQQRTISVAQYVNGDYSLGGRYFHNLQDDEQEQILDYLLQVYVCEGSASEKLGWFRTVNIAGEKLTDQELRNAVYAGEWVTDAKRYFSRSNGPAYAVGNKYVRGNAIRQDYLETAITWIMREDQTIEEYMGEHQHDSNAIELWEHFRSVLDQVEIVFPNYRSFMKGVAWGEMYADLKDPSLNPESLERDISRLVMDDDVTRKAGIYPYLISGEQRHLNLRVFTDAMKHAAYERQAGLCASCHKAFEMSGMEGDHITPWTEGGKTVAENCQMLCRECNRRKSNK